MQIRSINSAMVSPTRRRWDNCGPEGRHRKCLLPLWYCSPLVTSPFTRWTSSAIRTQTLIKVKSFRFSHCSRTGCVMLILPSILLSTISWVVSENIKRRCRRWLKFFSIILMIGKFRREFRNVLERGHCLTLKSNQRSNQWQSQYRSRYANDDQEHSFIHSTTHMIHITPSLKRNYACPVSHLKCHHIRID